MTDSAITALATILRKAQGAECAETGKEIDVGADVVRIKKALDEYRAESQRLRHALHQIREAMPGVDDAADRVQTIISEALSHD